MVGCVYDWPYSDARNTLGQMWSSQDAVQHVLDRPMAREPGAEWAYNSGTSILLGGILEQATGQDVLDFARYYLFDPLGIGDVTWAKATGHHYLTDGGLFMTPRDMARLGYLMLQGGKWDGVEIVSPEWVAQSTRAQQYTPWGDGYGYQWWTLPEMGAFAATGHYEQKIYVVPAYDLVVVFTADVADDDPHPTDGMLYRFVMAACNDIPREQTHKTYSNYGFSLEYPAGMGVSEEPIAGQDTVSDAAGTVQFVFGRYPQEIISVRWETGLSDVELETYIEESFVEMEQDPEIKLARGEYFEAHQDGHDIVYQRLSITWQDFEFAGVAGAWRCADRVYAVSYLTNPELPGQDVAAVFQEYLEGLVCH